MGLHDLMGLSTVSDQVKPPKLPYLVLASLLCLFSVTTCAPTSLTLCGNCAKLAGEQSDLCLDCRRTLSDASPKKECIISTPRGFFAEKGILGIPVLAESGERLELRWEGFLPVYRLYYFPPREKEGVEIGTCHFSAGCNKACYFFYDRNENGVPDAFSLIRYESLDYGSDEETPGYLDRYRHIYVVETDTYCVFHDLLFYRCPPPVSHRSDPCRTFCNPPYRTVESHRGPVPVMCYSELIKCESLFGQRGNVSAAPFGGDDE